MQATPALLGDILYTGPVCKWRGANMKNYIMKKRGAEIQCVRLEIMTMLWARCQEYGSARNMGLVRDRVVNKVKWSNTGFN